MRPSEVMVDGAKLRKVTGSASFHMSGVATEERCLEARATTAFEGRERCRRMCRIMKGMLISLELASSRCMSEFELLHMM